ncbi:prephenate dehydrogenase [Actinocatenispora thailandica]|nr:prephenate dehydrogenase/arogenate dehydrogenase family protein [Actinocatenispora thailandica]
MLRTVTVIGLGLIGGSVLRAAARAGHDCRGYDPDPATRSAARDAGDWRIDDSPGPATDGADLVVLAVPPAALPTVLESLAGHPGIVTDVASVKQPALAAVPTGVRFVAGHPMAGREVSGFAAGDAALFDDRPWVLCLDEPTALADWLAVAEFVLALGARAVPAVAAEHDDAVARVSHLPHLAAAALAAQAAGALPAGLAAGSFADGTRVAASPPALWADICAANAPAVRAALDRLIADLGTARAALDAPAPALETWFGAGHAARAGWPPTAGPAIPIPPERDDLLALGRAGGWLTEIAGTRLTAVLPSRPAAGTDGPRSRKLGRAR